MKKTHKKIAGFLGLLTVIAITAAAVLLPAPATQAADTTAVTDTITVRVVNESPHVDIDGIDSGEVITLPEQTFEIGYNNVDTVMVKLEHTDLRGVTTSYDLDVATDVEYVEGKQKYVVHFITGEEE